MELHVAFLILYSLITARGLAMQELGSRVYELHSTRLGRVFCVFLAGFWGSWGALGASWGSVLGVLGRLGGVLGWFLGVPRRRDRGVIKPSFYHSAICGRPGVGLSVLGGFLGRLGAVLGWFWVGFVGCLWVLCCVWVVFGLLFWGLGFWVGFGAGFWVLAAAFYRHVAPKWLRSYELSYFYWCMFYSSYVCIPILDLQLLLEVLAYTVSGLRIGSITVALGRTCLYSIRPMHRSLIHKFKVRRRCSL